MNESQEHLLGFCFFYVYVLFFSILVLLLLCILFYFFNFGFAALYIKSVEDIIEPNLVSCIMIPLTDKNLILVS